MPTRLDDPPASPTGGTVDAAERVPTPALDRLLSRARRRMRANRVLAASGPVLLAASTAMAVWAVASRLLLFPVTDGQVAIPVATAAVAAVALAAAVRIHDVWAARAVDRWTASHDRFATAVELRAGPGGGLGSRQIRETDAAAARLDRLPPRNWRPNRLHAAGAALLALATLAALAPNPKDAQRELLAAERAAVERESEQLRERAADLRDGGGEDASDLADDIDDLAAELDGTRIEEALARLEASRARLAEELVDDLAGRRTALRGLARSLGNDPLGAGDSVQEQLDDLAARLASDRMEADELTALAERLERLASGIQAGQPQVADALSAAAAAAASDDAQAASEALSRASGAVDDAADELRRQDQVSAADEAVAGAAADLEAVRDALAGARDPNAAATGRPAAGGDQAGADDAGSGADAGAGEAASGQGRGDARQGQGQGGGGSGNPQGQTSVTSPGGQGGRGGQSGATGTGDNRSADLDLTTVYDPPERAGAGDEWRPGASDTGVGPDRRVGERTGRGAGSEALVPYRDVLARYADQAGQTIERPDFPVRFRDLVRDYFDRIGAGDVR